ncbi:MAG: SLC13 family permease [Oscillospiraceae bacterium]|jgi:Na+/H+ antiporter NhaD/arsenite permease-like protein|nr:citrate transporter [Ruminococcus sp.]MDD7338841.1 SLC13 family permease [Ruminococcus sp.]MDY6061083.1 SLC13 family permease [Oscillospiraceae bacterium]
MKNGNKALSALNGIRHFISKNLVMCIAFVVAVITSVIVPVDRQYIGYFDFKTLTCLFCVLAVVCALKNIKFFYILADKIVRVFKNAKMCVLALVYITFIGSMLIANDMALLTFLPLGYFVLTAASKRKYMAFTFIMQNIAANLGGMLTPFGNPQNLYLYSKYNIPNLEFISIMALPFLFSIIIITVCCLIFVKSEPLKLKDEAMLLNKKRTALYLTLFALSIVIVFRVIPYWVGLIIIPPVLLVFDRKALKSVDYGLLFTFVFFFIFAGNMARIDIVRDLFSSLLNKNTLLVSIASCQFISNVPSAILLSQFTENYKDLLVGVNIGGVGTLISSLASLITFREYVKHNPGKTRYYIAIFSAFNFAFLIILTGIMYLLKII